MEKLELPRFVLYLPPTEDVCDSGIYMRTDDNRIYRVDNLNRFHLGIHAEHDIKPCITYAAPGAPRLTPVHEQLGDIFEYGLAIHVYADPLRTQIGLVTKDPPHTTILGYVQSLQVDLDPDSRRVVIELLRYPGWTDELSTKVATLGGIEIIVEEREVKDANAN
jgi:hypothetical protein